MTRVAITALLLTSCAQYAGPVMLPAATQEAVDAWRSAGLPYRADCGRPRFVVADAKRFAELCERPSCDAGVLPCAGSCFSLPSHAIVVTQRTNLRGHINHELLHWLAMSCGEVPDASHDNRIVWGVPLGAPGSLLHALGG